MLLLIDDNIKISELQDKFQECFPYLKIEFFKGQHALKSNTPAPNDLSIGSLSKKHYRGEIEIKSWYKSEKVLHDFKSQFGLLVRIHKLYNGRYIPLPNNEPLRGITPAAPVSKYQKINPHLP